METLEDRSLLSLGFSFAQGLGGNSLNIGQITTDASGNFYLVGSFVGTVNLDPNHTNPGSPSTLTSVTATNQDIYVAKYSAAGVFQWAKSAGGTLDDRAIGVAVDGSGNVYATGFFTVSATFGPGLTLNDPSGATVFVWKLNSAGVPQWATSAAGAPAIVNQGVGIVADALGHIDVTGSFRQTITFATISGNVSLTAGGTNDPFIAQLNSSGQFLWAESFHITPTANSTGFGQGISLASDGSGNIYDAGLFSGEINLAPGGSNQHTSPGGSTSLPVTDGFVVKLANNGSPFYGNTYGGTDLDESDGIAVDASGSAYVTGRFTGAVNFDPGHPSTALNTITPPIGYGIYALKLDPAGNFAWVTNLGVGNSNIDLGRPSVGLDGSGNAYFTGPFLGVAHIGASTFTSAGDSDIYVAKLAASSGAILDATRGGGGGTDNVEGLGITGAGDVVIGGDITPPANFGAFTVTSGGPNTIFFGRVHNFAVAPHVTQGDYDGDHKADLATYRPFNATWFLFQSTAGPRPFNFGAPNTDIPVPGDYDGDGKTDFAVFRPSTATWFILQSTAGPRVVQFGGVGDLPIQADFDGDGKTDLAVFRPSTAQWFILQSTAGPRAITFGAPRFIDEPMIADYDGDGKADIAVYRASTAQWFILQSTAGPRAVSFGAPNLDQPVPADYDGDGKADLAVLRPSTYTWFILRSTAGPKVQQFGGPGDFPMPEDYDGDGKADIAVYRFATAQWFILQTTAGPRAQSFGFPGVDFPMTAPFQYRFYGNSGGRTASALASSGAGSDGGSGTRSLAAVDVVPLVTASTSSVLVPMDGPSSSGSTRTQRTAAHDLALSSALDELSGGSSSELT